MGPRGPAGPPGKAGSDVSKSFIHHLSILNNKDFTKIEGHCKVTD